MDRQTLNDYADKFLQLALDFSSAIRYEAEDRRERIFQFRPVGGARIGHARSDPALPAPPTQVKKSNSKTVSACNPQNQKEIDDMLKLKGVYVSHKPRPDGRYQGRYKEHPDDLQYKYVYARSYPECCQKLLDLISGKVEPGKAKKASMSNNPLLADYLDFWYENYKKPKLKAQSRRSLENSIKLLKKLFPGKRLRNLTTNEIQEKLIPIAVERNRTANMALSELSRAYKKAILSTPPLAKVNPCLAVELPKTPPKHHPPLTRDHMIKFIETVRQGKHFFLFLFLLETGMRVGELLTISDLDIYPEEYKGQTYDYVHIDKDVVFMDGERIDQPYPKTAKSIRKFPLPRNLSEMYRRDYVAKGKTGLLFTMTYSGVDSAFGRAITKAGLDGYGYSIHSLRATFNTRAGEAGIPDKVRQEIMGHETQEMTQDTYNAAQTEYVLDYYDVWQGVFDTKIDTNPDKDKADT